jgi:hypothetical protein
MSMLIKEQHLRQYAKLFCHRRDIYAVQKKDGSDLLRRHLEGDLTCGWYALGPDNSVRWTALDADEEDGLVTLQHVWEVLIDLNIAAYLEDSRRGGHLWVFVEPLAAFVMRTLLKQVLDQLEVDEVEIYPRQDELTDGGVGSLVRGPLGVHQVSGQRYGFLDPAQLKPVGRSLIDQLDYLLTFQVYSIHRVAEALAVLMREAQPPIQEPFDKTRAGAMLRDDKLEALKLAIGDLYTFVSRYVELDAKGRGSCPFHPPDRHPSFAVNREEGYWVCFHETNPQTGRYLGGDAIEFYQRLKDLSFKEAVRELAEQYGLTDLSFRWNSIAERSGQQ